jgi:ComF family protein
MQMFTHYCVMCEQPCSGSRELCHHCETALPWNLTCCQRCALPLPDDANGLCARCLVHAPPCTGTIAPLVYDDVIAMWIPAFKFRGAFREGNLLAELLAGAVQKHLSQATPPDCIIPVPLSRRRLLLRGFNQAQLLAECIARGVHLPVNRRVLYRVRHTVRQAELPRGARRRNVAHAFAARTDLSGRRVALVDDVLTTGATLSAATRALLDAGAIAVEWWVAARAP